MLDNELLPKYKVSPALFRVPWANATWEEARQHFSEQSRYIKGVLDILYTQGEITCATASTIDQAVKDLETCLNELEIALRAEMQRKEEDALNQTKNKKGK